MTTKLKPMNGIAAIDKLGVAPALVAWLANAPIEVTLTASKFELKFTDPSPETEFCAMSVAVSLDQLQKLSQGTLSPVWKASLKDALTEAITALKAVHENPKVVVDGGSLAAPATPLPAAPAVGIGALPPIPGKPKTAPIPAIVPPAWAEFDPKLQKVAKPVPLRDATQMYQPVNGTSSGSRYFMVAAGDGIRVACRYDGAKLSIRIEGGNLLKWKSELAAMQMTPNTDYASIHLNVGKDAKLATKTLGAVLLGLGIPLDTPIPNLKKVPG